MNHKFSFLVQPSFNSILLIPIGALGIWGGFPNNLLELPILVFFWPLALTLAGMKSENYGQAFRQGWLISFLGSSLALYWLCIPVHEVGELPLILAIPCALLICAALSVQSGLYCIAAWRLSSLPPIRLALILGLVWYVLEYFFAVMAGFPWLALSGALAGWPLLIQASDLVGAYFNGSLWITTFLLIILGYRKDWSFSGLRPELVGYLLLAFLFVYGIFGINEHEGGDRISALYIDGNICQNQKWVPAFQQYSLFQYINLTRQGVQDARKDNINPNLTIWPETALPFFFERHAQYSAAVRECAINLQVPILFGAPAIVPGQGTEEAVYNRAFLMAPDGKITGSYDKMHLVPFGEYLPSWLDLEFLRALLQGVGVYHAGESASPLKFGPLALGMLICYEGIFPWLAQDRVEQGANILVDISNDGWFGNSPAARQHLYLTIPRCVEQNRWLLRAANTGISATISNRGRLVAEGPRFDANAMLAYGYLLKGKTVFHYLEPWLPWLAMGLALLIILASRQFIKGKDDNDRDISLWRSKGGRRAPGAKI